MSGLSFLSWKSDSLYSFSSPVSFTPFTCGGFSKLWRSNLKACCCLKEEFLLWSLLPWCCICYFCCAGNGSSFILTLNWEELLKWMKPSPLEVFLCCPGVMDRVGGALGLILARWGERDWELGKVTCVTFLFQWAFKLPHLFFGALS